MKKPDRFARVVEKIASDGFSGDAFAVSVSDAVKLLSAEHRAVVRLVRHTPVPKRGKSLIIPIARGYARGARQMRNDLLAALEERQQP